jgi:FKBP-type peptidyl-prolyl cis-trans isomerase
MPPLRICLLAVFLALPAAAFAQRERLSYDDLNYVEKTWPQAKKTDTSIRYMIEREGQGLPPRPGDVVYVNYVGRLLNGALFDQNLNPAKPFTFRVGRGQVIRGWDQMLQAMKPGEKRLVIVPSELAYGTKGWLPRIPRDATLVFDIEVLRVDREE